MAVAVTGPSDRWLAAHHEAGHALLALETGCELGRVAIGPRGAGLTRFRAPSVPPERARRDAVMRRLAGAAGEAVLLGFGALPFAEVERRCAGGVTDFARARHACGTGLSFQRSFLSWMWNRTVDLVVRRRPSVEALARALQAEGTIRGSRAAGILGGRR